jgi:outer membrane lipoprotein SlyB
MRVFVLLFAVVLLAGCASSHSGDVYSRDQARREMSVRKGVVESVRVVSVEGTKTGLGGISGAAIGGIAGSNLGGGKGQLVGAIIGVVAGTLAGGAIEENVTKKQALEITVELEGGKSVVIVQDAQPGEFRAGDRVRLVSGGGETRVTR